MPYTKQTWENSPSTATPISAARLTYIEDGIDSIDADVVAEAAARSAADALLIPLSQKGAASGVATLDSGSKIPAAQLPNSIMEYKGTWNATTNSPTLVDGTGSAGDVYRVSVAGSQDLGSGAISFAVGDYAVFNGSTWEKSDTTDSVPSVFGRTGLVVASAGDYTASQVTFVPAGSIAATTVQAAIEEVASEGGGAPANAPYIVTAADNTLSAEKVLGADIIKRGTAAEFAGVAAGVAGRLFDKTDGDQFVERDNGFSWDIFAIKGLVIQDDNVQEGAGIRTLDFGTGLDVAVTGTEAVITAPGGGSGGMLVAPTHTSPASTFTVTTTLADVDATNLITTFTAPANGKVRILVNAGLIVNTNSTKLQLALREGSTTVGPLQNTLSNNSASEDSRARGTAIWIITGLTAGPHTYKLAAQMATGTGTVTTDICTIEAWPVP